MKKGVLKGILVALAVIVAGGGAFLIGQALQGTGTAEATETVRTYAYWTEHDELSQVPALIVKGCEIGKAVDAGSGTCMIDVTGVDRQQYQDYLNFLQEQGYQLLQDNGTDGIHGDVFTAQLQKDEVSVTVTFLQRVEKVYVIAGENQKLSRFLTYDPASVAEPVAEQTSMTMRRLMGGGNNFVFRLKNGHFLINDCGQKEDMIYMIEYMESFMADGEKPVVDCWLITHAHADHMGGLYELDTHPEYAERVYVEELLYNQPNSATINKYGTPGEVGAIYTGAKLFKTTAGATTPVIRPTMGQKYYYCDVVAEMVFTQEFLPLDNYSEDLNDSSTWVMYNIEGQKVLLTGDGDYGEMVRIKWAYDPSYFDLDVYQNPHHGINVFDDFTDYLTIKTVVVPYYDEGLWPRLVAGGVRPLDETRVKANEHLVDSCQEIMAGGEGDLVLYFPYSVGSAVRLDPIEWTHHVGQDVKSAFVEQ